MLIIIMGILLRSSTVYAHEQEHIVWPEKGELIQVSNVVPGSIFHRTIRILGRYSFNSSYYFRILLMQDDHQISQVLWIAISQHGKNIYSSTLRDFAGKIHNIAMEDIEVTITFDRNAGNIYQKSSTRFSAEIGVKEKAYNKNKNIWEICKRFMEKVRDKVEKVRVRPR